MGTQETGRLRAKADTRTPEQEIIINPNDGFDIGLMMTEADVALILGKDPESRSNSPAKVIQKNECGLGTVELNGKVLEKIGSPRHVRLVLLNKGSRPTLFIAPA